MGKAPAHTGDFEGPDVDDFEVDWDRAEIVDWANKVPVSLRLDSDVLAFFRESGPGYQTRINTILRAYMDAKAKAKQATP